MFIEINDTTTINIDHISSYSNYLPKESIIYLNNGHHWVSAEVMIKIKKYLEKNNLFLKI